MAILLHPRAAKRALQKALEDIDASIDIELNDGNNAPEVEIDDGALPPEGGDVDLELDAEGGVELDIGEPGGDADIIIDTPAQAESDAEDADMEDLAETVTALEGLLDLVEAMPAQDGKFGPTVLRGLRPALEANDLVAANSTALVADGNKQAISDRVKDFIKQAIAALVKMALEAMARIQQLWSQATDKLMRAAAAAKTLKGKISSTQFSGNAAISDEKLIAAIGGTGGISVQQALDNAFEHASAMGERATSEMLANAGAAIREIASGKPADGSMQKLYASIESLAGTYPETTEVNGESASASKPFFGGFRAWARLPANLEDLDQFNHGLTQVDKTGAAGNMNAGAANELLAICDSIIQASSLVATYRKKLSEEQKLVNDVKSAAAGARDGDESVKAAMTKINKMLPKIVKGPQVAAYNYAGTAAAIALRFVSASLAAQAGENTPKQVEGGGQPALAAPAA